MLWTRSSRLQVHDFAQLAGVIFARPPCHVICLALQCTNLPIKPESLLCGHLAVHSVFHYGTNSRFGYKAGSGEIQSLAMHWTKIACLQAHEFAHEAGIIFCGHLGVHSVLHYRSIPGLATKRLLGRSSRWLVSGPDFRVYRCMNLPTKLDSVSCGHPVVCSVLRFTASFGFVY